MGKTVVVLKFVLFATALSISTTTTTMSVENKSTFKAAKNPYLESLGHDILVNNVFPYLSEDDLNTLGHMSPILKQFVDDPAVWHDLFYRTFGTQPNPFTAYNWPEMYRWRSKAGLYTWGEEGNGRLGYRLDTPNFPQDILTPSRFPHGVCRPHKVDSLTNIVISDIVTGGFWSAILTAKGEIYGIGELTDYQNVPNYSQGTRRDRDLFDRLRGGADFPIMLPQMRIGGVINRGHNPTPDSGVGNARNFPLTPHRPRIDHPNVRESPTNTDNSSSNPNLTNNIVLPNMDNFEDLSAFEPQSTSQNHDDEDDGIDYTEGYISSERVRSKLLDVMSFRKIRFTAFGGGGRMHLLGLDTDHNIWTWDRLFGAPGVKLDLDFNQHRKKPLEVRKLSAAWNCNAALVEGHGLTVWYDIGKAQILAKTRTEQKAWKEEEKSYKVTTTVIPHTNQRKGSPDYVVDFHAGDGYIVYLTEEGKLFRVSTRNPESIRTGGRTPLTAFDETLQSVFKKTLETQPSIAQSIADDYKPKFVRVRGGYKYIAAISDSDNVLYAEALDNYGRGLNNPEAPAELQNVGCISIAAGDYHFLALLKGGKLLSWGSESQRCGSLGLGNDQAKIAVGGVLRGADFVVSRPTPVQTPGKVLAIAAGGWQSSAIITTENIEEK